MKIYNNIGFSNLSINKEMRSDFKFHNWYNKNNLSFSESMRLKEFVSNYYKGYACKDGPVFRKEELIWK